MRWRFIVAILLGIGLAGIIFWSAKMREAPLAEPAKVAEPTASVAGSNGPTEAVEEKKVSPDDAELRREVLRLRGEVAALRRALREGTNVLAGRAEVADGFVGTNDFRDAGMATPEASIQTLCWAAFLGDKERLKESIVWGEEAIAAAKASMRERFNLEEVFFTVSSPPGRMEGFRILGAELVAPERMLARVEITTRQGKEAVTELKRVPLILVNGEWKWFVKNPADVHAIPFRERKE